MNFFTKNPNLNFFLFFFFGGGGGMGVGARVSEFFYAKNSNRKKKLKKIFCVGGVGWGA